MGICSPLPCRSWISLDLSKRAGTNSSACHPSNVYAQSPRAKPVHKAQAQAKLDENPTMEYPACRPSECSMSTFTPSLTPYRDKECMNHVLHAFMQPSAHDRLAFHLSDCVVLTVRVMVGYLGRIETRDVGTTPYSTAV